MHCKFQGSGKETCRNLCLFGTRFSCQKHVHAYRQVCWRAFSCDLMLSENCACSPTRSSDSVAEIVHAYHRAHCRAPLVTICSVSEVVALIPLFAYGSESQLHLASALCMASLFWRFVAFFTQASSTVLQCGVTP